MKLARTTSFVERWAQWDYFTCAMVAIGFDAYSFTMCQPTGVISDSGVT